jgi:hypothetical protein
MQGCVSISFLMFVELFAYEYLLASQVLDGLLYHSAKDVSRELALGIVPFFGGHSPRSLRICLFIHQRRDFSVSLWALMLPIK